MYEEISKVPTEASIRNYASIFNDEADGFKTASKLWLNGIIGCLVGVALFAILFGAYAVSNEYNSFSLNQLIQFNLSKILIFSDLLYGLTISNKNYKANKHNQVLNKHRANALSSFQAFAESKTADEVTKKAVLLEATSTIYSSQATGYVSVENDDSTNHLVELVKSLVPVKAGSYLYLLSGHNF